MKFDEWMLIKDKSYVPTDDSVYLRLLRECWFHRDAEIESLRQQVTLLRSTIHKAMGTCFDQQSYERCMADPTYFINVALGATEPKS